MMRYLAVSAALAVLLALSFASVAEGKRSSTHKPPYRPGPSGGDEFNHIESDPETGEMSIWRVFPGFSPVVGCEPEPSAGWSMFRVKHQVTKPVERVVVHFEEATLDPYAWMTVSARDESKDWLGTEKLQGPLSGSGKLTARLFDRPKSGDQITLEFGLQLGDACPQVSHASATFARVSAR